MERISAPTFFIKRVFPWLWVGIAGIAALFCLWVAIPLDADDRSALLPFLVTPVILPAGAAVVFYWLFAPVADSVDEDRDHLLVRRGGIEQRIMLSDVLDVGRSTISNPPKLILRLRTLGAFGGEIVFIPRFRWVGLSQTAERLKRRADEARNPQGERA